MRECACVAPIGVVWGLVSMRGGEVSVSERSPCWGAGACGPGLVPEVGGEVGAPVGRGGP